jgi:hypothetical protein
MPVTLHWVHKTRSAKGGLWGPPFLPLPGLLQQPPASGVPLCSTSHVSFRQLRTCRRIRSAPLWATSRLSRCKKDCRDIRFKARHAAPTEIN